MAEPETSAAAQPNGKRAQPTNTDPVGLIVFVHGLHPPFQELDYTGIEALLKDKIEKHDGFRHDLYVLSITGRTSLPRTRNKWPETFMTR